MIDSDRERLADRLSNRITGNEELRLLAYGELCRRISRADPVPEAVCDANAHLASAEANRAIWRRRIEKFQVVGIFVVLLSVGGLIWRWAETYQAIGEINTPDEPALMHLPPIGWSLTSTPNPGDGPVGGRLKPDDSHFLLGLPPKISDCRYPPPPAGQSGGLGLWRRALEKTSELPSKVEPFFANLPEDAQCDLLAAGMLSPLAIGEESRWNRTSGTTEHSFTITNPEHYRLAREFMRSAAARDTNTDESTALNRRAHSLLPPRKDILTEMIRANAAAVACVRGTDGSGLRKIIGTEAQEAVRKQDVSRFRKLLEDWRGINRHLSGHPECRSYLHTTSSDLLHAADSMGITGETEDIAAIQGRIPPNQPAYHTRNQSWHDAWKRYGCLFKLDESLLNATPVLPRISRADFLPMRHAHHAYVMGYLSLAAAGFFLAVIVVFGTHRLWHGKQARLISLRLPELLKGSDAAWIAALGIGLPLAWLLFVTLVSPFSVRSESRHQGFMVLQCTSQQIATITLMLLSIVLAARWRIHRRCAVTGIARPALWPGLTCALLTSAMVPVFGHRSYPQVVGFYHTGQFRLVDWIKSHGGENIMEYFVEAGGVLLFPAWIWLAAGGIRALLGSREKSLARLALSRVMISACAVAILANCAMLPLWHAVERHWVAKDTLFDIVPESGMPRIEHEIIQANRKEFRFILTGTPE